MDNEDPPIVGDVHERTLRSNAANSTVTTRSALEDSMMFIDEDEDEDDEIGPIPEKKGKTSKSPAPLNLAKSGLDDTTVVPTPGSSAETPSFKVCLLITIWWYSD